jgi:hypothetical protein
MLIFVRDLDFLENIWKKIVFIEKELLVSKGLKSLLVICLVLCISSTTFGWGSSPATTHERMANRILDHPNIQAYIAQFGLNRTTIAGIANTEPPTEYHHPGWSNLRDRSTYLDWPVNNTIVGYIIHIACDCGVACCHSPANEVWCDDVAESVFEGSAEARSIPSLTGLYSGDYNTQMSIFYTDQMNLVYNFKYWWEHTWYCPLCDPGDYAVTGMTNGLRLTYAVLIEYFNYHTMQATVISANGGESLLAGTNHTITWQTLGTFQNILLQYSTNNGATWIPINTVPNTGSYVWQVPSVNSSQCLIRLSDTEYPQKNDISNNVFTIYTGSITVNTPNGGEALMAGNLYDITWSSVGSFPNVSIDYSSNNGGNWTPVDTTANTGSYEWLVPELNSVQCLVRVSDPGYTISDTSNAPFTIYICTLLADMTGDCYVDINDLVIFANSWLWCNDPANPDCSN